MTTFWERGHITNADIYLEQYPRIWETLDRSSWVRDLVFGLRRHLIDAATERDRLRAEVETLVRAAEKCSRRALHAEVKRLRAEVAEVGELEAQACMRHARAHDQAEAERALADRLAQAVLGLLRPPRDTGSGIPEALVSLARLEGSQGRPGGIARDRPGRFGDRQKSEHGPGRCSQMTPGTCAPKASAKAEGFEPKK